ncbi:MAG: MBL fold metallo-hydrolase [candidate division Zixibacteria bacterium]|nr:MBL fold metallo-hydrolase [candidate division Zixibacteria bacterium]
MLTFQVIGCASGMPHPKLAGSSYLVRQGGRLLLFDAGEGLSSALRRLDVDPRQIGTIFISHMHSDHFIGVPLFIQMNYLLERRQRLDIFLPAEAVGGMRRLLNLTYLFPHKLGFELELHKITRSFSLEMINLKVTPQANSHLQGHAKHLRGARLANKWECYSFVIESGGRKIVYSADLGDLDDLLPVLADTDLLVLDGMHVDLTQLPAVAVEHSVKRVLLTHLPEEFDFKKVKEHCRRQGLRQVYQAKEGLMVDI